MGGYLLLQPSMFRRDDAGHTDCDETLTAVTPAPESVPYYSHKTFPLGTSSVAVEQAGFFPNSVDWFILYNLKERTSSTGKVTATFRFIGAESDNKITIKPGRGIILPSIDKDHIPSLVSDAADTPVEVLIAGN